MKITDSWILMSRTVIFLFVLTTFASAQEGPRVIVDLDGGRTFAQHEIDGYYSHQAFSWMSAGYRPTSWLEFGVEGGHLFGKRRENSDAYAESIYTAAFASSLFQSASYVGPYVQANLPTSHIEFSFRAGLGTAMASIKRQSILTTTPSSVDFIGYGYNDYYESHENDLAAPLAVAAEFKLTANIAVGAGLRDLMVFRRQGQYTYVYSNGTSTSRGEERLQVRHFLMPFGRLSFRFGGSNSTGQQTGI